MPTKSMPIYLFLGEEDFLKKQAIEKLASQSLEKSTKDLNYSVFYANKKDFNIPPLLDCLNTLPFLSKKRLVILKDADQLSSTDKKSILRYLDSPMKSSVFVIESREAFIKGDFLLEVSKKANLLYYRRLNDSAISAWLVKKANFYGKKMSSEAIKAVKENLPNDLRVYSSNMENIILYTGKKEVITKEIVEKVIGVSPSHTAFDLMEGIEKKDAKKALRVFLALRKDKKKEIELLGLLAWNARMILRIKELLKIKEHRDLRSSMALSPRIFDRIVGHASRFKKDEVLSLLDQILKADLDIKTGASPTLVLERLIVRVCS